jgi:hypothetical protein
MRLARFVLAATPGGRSISVCSSCNACCVAPRAVDSSGKLDVEKKRGRDMTADFQYWRDRRRRAGIQARHLLG